MGGREENDLRLGFEADLSQLDSAARSLRNYIQATVDAVKAETDMNAASLQLASSQGIVADSIRDSFSNASTSRLGELATNTDKATESMDSLRNSIAAIKDQVEDPSLQEALGNFGKIGGEGGGLSRRSINDVARGVGLVSPGAGEAVRIGNDVKEFAEVLPKLADGIGELGPAAAIAAPALVVLTIGIQQFAKEVTDGGKALQTAIDADNKYYQNVSTLTTQAVQDQIEGLNKRNDAIKDQILKEAKIVELGKEAIINEFSGLFNTIGFLFGTATGDAIKNLASGALTGGLQSNVDKLNQELSANSDLIAEDTQGLKENAFAANDAKEGTDKLTQSLYKYAQDAIGAAVDAQIQIGDLIKNGSEQQLNDAIAAAQKQVEATKLKIAAEYELAKKYENDPILYGEISQTITDLQAQQTTYQHSLDELSNSMVRAYVVSNDAAAKQAEIQSKQADSFQKYLDNQAKAESDYQDAQTNAYTKYTDNLQQIADNAVKAAEQALEKLEQKRSDLATKFEQTQADDTTKFHDQQLDDQIKYQREQVLLTQEHQRNLKKILADEAAEEQNLILNRDFAGLFNLRQQTQRRISDENDNYQTQQQQRLQAFQDQENDEARHFAEQEQQTQLNYQRELQSAQLQYQREQQAADKARRDALQKAQDGYNAELQQLANKHQQQLQLAHDAEVQELQLIAQGNAQKLQLEQGFYQQSVAFLRNAIAQVGAAGSGAISGSNSSIPGASNRNGGGSGGAVITNNNGASIGAFSLTQNISGRDEQRIAEIAAAQTQKILADFIK